MCLKTISRPTSGGMGGITGKPFSKKSIGDFTGSNFEGAHHLQKAKKTENQHHQQQFIENWQNVRKERIKLIEQLQPSKDATVFNKQLDKRRNNFTEIRKRYKLSQSFIFEI